MVIARSSDSFTSPKSIDFVGAYFSKEKIDIHRFVNLFEELLEEKSVLKQ